MQERAPAGATAMLECRFSDDLDAGSALALSGTLRELDALAELLCGGLGAGVALELERDADGPAPYRGFLEGLRVIPREGTPLHVGRDGLDLIVTGGSSELDAFADFLATWLTRMRPLIDELDASPHRSVPPLSIELDAGQPFVAPDSDALTLRVRIR